MAKADAAGDGPSGRDFALAARSRWLVAVLTGALAGLAAFFYASLQPAEYVSTATIRLTPADIASVDLQDIYQAVSAEQKVTISAAQIEHGLSISVSSTPDMKSALSLQLLDYPDVEAVLNDLLGRLADATADTIISAERSRLRIKSASNETTLALRVGSLQQFQNSAKSILDGEALAAEKIRVLEVMDRYMLSIERLEDAKVDIQRQLSDISQQKYFTPATDGRLVGQRSPGVFAVLAGLSGGSLTLSVLVYWRDYRRDGLAKRRDQEKGRS